MSYTKDNAAAWDAISGSDADGRSKFTRAVSHETFLRAQAGEIAISLTSAKSVPKEWFPPLKNCCVLALASGGGQQGPIFAAHGAEVTVTDISSRQIEAEHYVAAREGCSIRAIQCDMAEPLPFEDDSFDLIFNPVSNCYIRDILPVWVECARVLRPGGILMTGFVKEEHFMFEPDFANEDCLISRHPLPFSSLDLPEERIAQMRENREPFIFSHTLTEQLGGLMQAGFMLTDLYEDGDGGGLFDKYMRSYVAVRAVKAFLSDI